MAAIASHLPPADDFACQQSFLQSLHEPFSSPPATPLNVDTDHIFDFTPPSTESGGDLPLGTDLTQISLEDRRNSSASSISTFPGSVIQQEPAEELRIPSRSTRPQTIKHDSVDSFVSTSSRRRDYAPAFRNPSSVRAMQMKDGDEVDIITPHRRSGSQFSIRSNSSAHAASTSPYKRYSRSSQSSPLKNSSKLKKEFPLVLLHCTLLPPTNGLLSPQLDSDLFGAVLPEEYRKRWATLQDCATMAEVKARGILIPHPQEDYELLEERLLESLELEKPRIRSSHFIRQDGAGADSGFESASQTDEEDANSSPHGFQCPDCGKGVDPERHRRWEIKVYAANGLMRAGAWAAAWREMEKVDVEIGLWMPKDVRQEVNARLEAIKVSEHDSDPEQQSLDDELHDSRQREIYGAARHAKHHPDPSVPCDEQKSVPLTTSGHEFRAQDERTGLQAYFNRGVAFSFLDQKNVLVILLSIMIMYLLTGTNLSNSTSKPSTSIKSGVPKVVTTTVMSTATFTPTTTLADMLSSTRLLDDFSSTALQILSSTALIDEESLPDPTSLQTSPQKLAEAILPASAEFLELREE